MALAKPTEAALQRAAALLGKGRLVAFATETVYGLGAAADDPLAVRRLYAAKGRPRFNPLIAHVFDVAGAKRLVRFDARAEILARLFWPGPLTLVLPRLPGASVSRIAAAGLDTLGVRIPDHPAAQKLLRKFGRAIVAPSANRSGRLSPTDAGAVERALGARVALILDGGTCRVGLESTIVDLSVSPARLLREGGIVRAAIEAAIGKVENADATIKAPGMLASHYAPRADLRLNAAAPRAGEAYLGFGPLPTLGAEVPALTLSATGNLAEAAHNLFAYLQTLDRPTIRTIAVANVPAIGLGAAIRDRLARAAAPRGRH